jgi:hypothetical protein
LGERIFLHQFVSSTAVVAEEYLTEPAGAASFFTAGSTAKTPRAPSFPETNPFFSWRPWRLGG